MRGASRVSLAELTEQLDAAIPPPATSRPAPARAETADKVGDELFAVFVPVIDSGKITALYTIAAPDKLAVARRQARASRNAVLPSQ